MTPERCGRQPFGVTLREAVQRLAELDGDATIYVHGAPDSWTPESDARVGVEDVEAESESLPPEAEGRTYFLEVAVAKEVLSGWTSNLDHVPTLEETVKRLIYYARYDA
jgi:hypothetical protein